MKRAIQGVFGVPALIFGPAFAATRLTHLAFQLGLNRLANLAFGTSLWWVFLLLPHFLIPSLGRSSALVLAVAQWSLVGGALGAFTRRKSGIAAVAIGLLGVVAVAAGVHGALYLLGYSVEMEGP